MSTLRRIPAADVSAGADNKLDGSSTWNVTPACIVTLLRASSPSARKALLVRLRAFHEAERDQSSASARSLVARTGPQLSGSRFRLMVTILRAPNALWALMLTALILAWNSEVGARIKH